MDRHRGSSSDGFDVSGGGEGGGGARYSRGPSRWSSSSSGTSPSHGAGNQGFSRRGGGDGFNGGGGGRFHPYRAPREYGFRGGNNDGGGGGGGGDGGEFGGPAAPVVQVGMGAAAGIGGPAPGPRGRFFGRGGGVVSPENDFRTNYVKLFVGSVPRTATEDEIRPLFEEHGDVLEVALIKDRKTGEQQGCCFVKYATAEEADRAIRALHNQYTLPGAIGPIQVRYADGERERHGAIEHKLFVASLNKQATPKEIEEIFAPYGHVEDVYIMRDGMRQSRGCGFVKFSNREAAMAAMNALSGTYVMRGCDQPLILRFADPKRPRPGESRGGPTFGGPGLSPRSDAALVIRPTANLDEPKGRRMPTDSWHPSNTQSLGPQFNNFGSDNLLAAKSGVATASSENAGSFGPTVFPASGALPSHSASGNSSITQIHPIGGPQVSPLQKLPTVQQNFPPLQVHNAQQMSLPNPQAQAMHSSMQQLGQRQVPQSVGFNSFGQNPPSLQLSSFGGQLPNSQPLMQQNPSGASLQANLSVQQQGIPSMAGQQQLPSSNIAPQMAQQPIQQMPTQVQPLLLQQQKQALQSSYQSAHQALLQIQQQVQQMQQQSNLNQQQASKAPIQQATFAQQVASNTTAGAPAAAMPTITAAPQQAPSPAVSLTCNWSEHTAPQGDFKYYYNSVTRESRWEKPEEFLMFEQQQQRQLMLQQQQQNLAVQQQLQSPSQAQSFAQTQATQQLLQMQPGQAHLLMKQQAQIPAHQQSVSDINYNQLQAANSLDATRIQQGIQAAQGLWKK